MIYIHLATGFEEVEALSIADILRRCGVDGKLVSIEEEKLVTGVHGITVEADLLFSQGDYDACQAIVLPGGMPGTTNLMAHKGLEEKILDFVNKDKLVAAICAAPLVLGRLGILKDKKATIYDGMEEELKGATYLKEDVVRDGNFLTSRGPGTAMEFALKLGEIIAGKQVSQKVRKELLYESRSK